MVQLRPSRPYVRMRLSGIKAASHKTANTHAERRQDMRRSLCCIVMEIRVRIHSKCPPQTELCIPTGGLATAFHTALRRDLVQICWVKLDAPGVTPVHK